MLLLSLSVSFVHCSVLLPVKMHKSDYYYYFFLETLQLIKAHIFCKPLKIHNTGGKMWCVCVFFIIILKANFHFNVLSILLWHCTK